MIPQERGSHSKFCLFFFLFFLLSNIYLFLNISINTLQQNKSYKELVLNLRELRGLSFLQRKEIKYRDLFSGQKV